MAINQLNDYSVGDASIDDVMVTLDATRRGHIALTLTNMDSTGVPAIAAGSIVEVGGALFEFTTDTALSGSPSDGTVYIKLVPSGTAPTITLTPTMTNTAPTWSDAKQGWYGTLTAAGDRYVGKCVKNSSNYYGKVVLKALSSYIEKLVIGELDMYWNGFYSIGPLSTGTYFNVKKPIHIVAGGNGGAGAISTVIANKSTMSATSLVFNTASIVMDGNAAFLRPGQYKVRDGANTYSLLYFTIIGVEGITDLNEGNISSVFEIA